VFADGSQYLDRLLDLARQSLACTLAELGLGEERPAPSLSREEVHRALEEAYGAAGESLAQGVFLPLEYLFRLFDCDAFERYAVVMALLSQLEPEAGAAFRRLHGDQRLDAPTPWVLSRLYGEPGDLARGCFAYFTRGSKLLRYFFALEEVQPLSRLTLDGRILSFALGAAAAESYYAPVAVLWSGGEDVAAGEGTAAGLAAYIRNCRDFGRHTVFNLFGPPGAGRKSCIKRLAALNGLNLLFIDLMALSPDLVPKIVRECLLFQAVPVVDNIPAEWSPAVQGVFARLEEALTEVFPYSFAVSPRRLLPGDLPEGTLLLAREMGRLSLEEAVGLWEKESRRYPVDQGVNFYELAGAFKLTPGNIKGALRAAQALAGLEGSETITFTHLRRGCYYTLPMTMTRKAVKLEPVYTWDDLVLPPYQKNLLKTACDQVRYKYLVYQKWGFQKKISYGRSVSMLFTGPPGTGKTMAAQVVARELGLDVYKIELATVVSKYVGEREKNLNEIFDQAQQSQVILFFDEADVLFSKRTEVKESTDKYSNMEAAFLLQKMEEYDGVAILATNYIQNFDEAFKRRLKFVIDFPFPNEEQRRQIWEKVFPPEVPLGELDFDFLTSRFELSGSNIKNIALHSAFLAAAEGSGKVEMKHVLAAIRNEYAKSGKTFTKEDAGEYYVLL